MKQTAEVFTLADGYDRRKKPSLAQYRAMTFAECAALHSGQHCAILARDGKARTVKINGAPKTWRRDSSRLEIPVKYGMYEYATFTWRPGSGRCESFGLPSVFLIRRTDETEGGAE